MLLENTDIKDLTLTSIDYRITIKKMSIFCLDGGIQIGSFRISEQAT
jgi:hypothetical protein